MGIFLNNSGQLTLIEQLSKTIIVETGAEE